MPDQALAGIERALRDRPRTWLVTGAAGFIGSHLVERLLALGQTVHGLDDFSTGRRENLEAVERALGPGAFARLRMTEGDVRDPRTVLEACRGAELVLHQAGLGSIPRSLTEPERSLAVNAEGTWVVLDAARRAGAARCVFASSSSVYGDSPEVPQREERLGRPLSPYAASKRAAELAAEGFARGLGFPVVALRYFNVFGPRQDPRGPYAAVVARWSADLVAGRPPRLEGDGRQTRDFTPVAAAVAANLLAACTELAEPWAAVNVGTGRETALVELLARLVETCAALGLDRRDLRPERAAARPGDRRASRADLSRARAWLGYEPPPDLAAGLGATVQELVDSRVRAS